MNLQDIMALRAEGTSEGVVKEWQVRKGNDAPQTNASPMNVQHPQAGQFQRVQGPQTTMPGQKAVYQAPMGSKVTVAHHTGGKASVHFSPGKSYKSVGHVSKGGKPSFGKKGGGKVSRGRGVTGGPKHFSTASFLSMPHKQATSYLSNSFGIQHHFNQKAGL